ncbi:hypothetical protein pb186bvf_006874 [Paramecium bursaria]
MYYPSSGTYTTQTMRKHRKINQKNEDENQVVDYQAIRLQQQNQELLKDIQQAQQDIINCEKLRRDAEEKLYQMRLKYDDQQREIQLMREKVVKTDGDRRVAQAEAQGEIRALRAQISALESEKTHLLDENNQLKAKNEMILNDLDMMWQPEQSNDNPKQNGKSNAKPNSTQRYY